MDVIAAQPTPDEDVESTIRHAQEEIDRSIDHARLTRDPLRLPLLALRATLGALLRIHTATTDSLREAAAGLDKRMETMLKRPIEPSSLTMLERAAANGADRRAAELARAHNWRTLAMLAGIGLGVLLTGISTGWLAHGDGVERACVSRGEIRADTDGRRFCVVWLDPAPAGKGQ